MTPDYDPTKGYYTIRNNDTGVLVCVAKSRKQILEIANSIQWSIPICVVNPKGFVIAD